MTAHFLIKATLAPAQHNVGALLADTARADHGHRLVWTLFPSEPEDRVERSFLYRAIDERSFLVLSGTLPRDDHALWHIGDPKSYEPEPRTGEHYGFILRANPVMAVRTQSRQSIRVDAVMHAKRAAKHAGQHWGREEEEAAALNWLWKREAAIGVAFDREACHAREYRQHRIAVKKHTKPIRFSSVDYEGLLTVTDPERFTAALVNGIGKARAFGCGLMLIRRA